MSGQVSTFPTSIAAIMGSPYFALGVADARAGRTYHRDYDTWRGNPQWNYDRGRLWAKLAPKSLPLKRNGKLTREAMNVYERHRKEIL
jgi:hypothetical protein